MSDHLTQVSDLNEMAKQTPAGCASHAGGGPVGMQCRDCIHWGANRKRKPTDRRDEPHATGRARCQKYWQIMGKRGPTVPADTESCKHFDRKPQKWHGPRQAVAPQPTQPGLFT